MSSKQMIIVSQSSSAKAVLVKLANDWKAEMTQWSERVDIHTCETL